MRHAHQFAGLLNFERGYFHFRSQPAGRFEAFFKRLLQRLVSQNIHDVHGGGNIAFQQRIQTRFGQLHRILRPDQGLSSVGQFHVGEKQVIFGNQSYLEIVFGDIAMRFEHFHRLSGCLVDFLRAQNIKVSRFNVPDHVLNPRRFLQAGNLFADAAGLIIGQNSAAGKKRLSGFDDPVVIVFRSHGSFHAV